MGRKKGRARRRLVVTEESRSVGGWSGLWWALLLVVGVIAAYQPAWHGGFVYEDEIFARDNPLLTASGGLWRIWFTLQSPSQYFPLTHTAFYVQRALWSGGTTGYHWVNIILHACSAVVLWRLLTRLKIPGAWVGAAFFALHPVQVESVAQISELKNVLSGLFFIGSLLFWARYAEEGRLRFWVLAFGFALLALAAKTTTCVLPAAMVLIFWWCRKPLDRKFWLSITPFALTSGIAAVVAYDWERDHNSSSLAYVTLGPIEHVLVASRAIFFYLGKLAWPANLMFNYPRWDISRAHPSDYIWPAALILLAVAIVVLRRTLGRGPETSFAYFVATLSPLLGFVTVYPFRYSFVADHYQYLACIGPLALAAAGLAHLLRDRRALAAAISAILVGLVTFMTWQQAHAFASAETLWTDTIRKNPQSWMAENNYGFLLHARDDRPAALKHFERSYQLNPSNRETARNLGQCLLEIHEPTAARPYLEQAVLSDEHDGQARRELARALLELGQPQEALDKANEAVTIDPKDAEAYVVLASILLEQGRSSEALANLEKAISLAPQDVEAETQMANLLLQAGRQRDASAILSQILAQRPDDPDALKNYAWILATASDPSLRDGTRAVALARRALDRVPQSPFVQATLAAAYAEAGQFPEALKLAEIALAYADANHLTGLTDLLRSEIALFQAGQPVRSAQ